MSYAFNFLINILMGTVSNAYWKSRIKFMLCLPSKVLLQSSNDTSRFVRQDFLSDCMLVRVQNVILMSADDAFQDFTYYERAR